MSLTPSPSLAAGHLGAEEVAERLRREQPLARKEGREVERRRSVDAGRKLQEPKGEAFVRDVRQLEESPCRGATVPVFGVLEFEVKTDCNALLAGRKRGIDNKIDSCIAVGAAAMQGAGLRADLKGGRLARLDIGQCAAQHLPHLDERRAVRDQTLIRRPVAVKIILRRERLWIMIDDAADRRVHGEGDRDHVIESRHQIPHGNGCSGSDCGDS